MMSSGEELQIEISGITDISEAEIEVHFQKKKYGGGDVNVTRLEDDKAIMIIEGISPEMLEKILEMKHVIDDQELTLRQIVSSPPATDLFTELPPLTNDSGTVVVRGFQQEVHKDVLELYFTHEPLSGGGPIDKIVMNEKEAFIVFTDQATAIRVAERGHHVIVGQGVDVHLVTSEPPTGEQLRVVTSANTLLVKGLNAQYHDKAMLELYFSNGTKCRGGDIAEIIIVSDNNEAYITFVEPEVAARVAEKRQHNIVGHEVEVLLVVPEPAIEEQLHTVTSTNTLLIKGLNAQYHNKAMLELYFSNEIKCRGGDIAEIVIVRDSSEAYITFIQPEVAARVAEKRQHNVLGYEVEVHLVNPEPWPATEEQLHTVTSTNTLLIKGLNAQYHSEVMLELYFSNQTKCGGGDIAGIIVQGTEAYLTYAEPGVAAKVAGKRQHDVFGHGVEVQLLVSEPPTGEQLNYVTSASTVLVKGLNAQYHNEPVLELYFSNEAKCGGGNIAEILVKNDEAYITYAEPKVAARVAEKRYHSLIGHEVEVQLVGSVPASKSLVPQDSEATDSDTILVRGLKDCHTESTLNLYFTNEKKCGGGDVTKIIINKDSAYVSFVDPKVAVRVAEKKVCKIMGYIVEVALFTGAIEEVTSDDPTSVVSDNILILENVPSSMNDDVLMLYIDNATKLDGEENDYRIDHDDAEVVITFHVALDAQRYPAGLDDVIQKISNRPFEGNVIQARRPLVLNHSILIDNLPTQKCNKDMLDMYFTNKNRSGIETYKEIVILDDNRAIVHLESKDDMLQSLKHDHSRLGDSVVVTECKVPPTGTSSDSLRASSSRTLKKNIVQNAFVIEVSKPFVNCLKKNTEEIEKQLSQFHAAISVDTEMNQVKISPCSGSEDLEDWETNCQSVVQSYLKSLITETFSFSDEIKDVMVPVILKIMQSQPLLHIEYDEESFTVVIVGEQTMVDKVKERLEEAYDSQMIKKESMPIEDQKFWSFLCVKLDELCTDHPKIEASLQVDENCVSILGIKDSRKAFKNDLESLRDGMASVKVKISKDLAEFLSTPLGRTLLHQYLQDHESLVAVHFEPEGVLYLLCSRKNDGIKVAKIIQENLSLHFVPYPEVFVASLSSKQWATMKADLEESYCISISIVSNKIKLIGDKGSLDHVSKQVQQFIDQECNVEKSIPLCEAQWRLLTTHMVNKWSKVEQKLKGQSKLKVLLPNEGDKKSSIILKGEKLVVADFAKQIEDLISTICTKPPLEQARPGTVKFFYSEKGKTLIMGVETQEKSCVQLDVLQDKDGDTDDLIPNGVSKSRNDKLGMGTTKEGKIITLVKGDITEIPVDVIVNASNADLKHIGGVALAIANKGGPIIQEESDRYTRREGKLSDGDAIMMKEVGELPCKRLIHAVGPRWNGGLSKEEAFLKRACLEALKLAKSFKTVSFPAISSGVFGFPINKCATCMIKAFIEYSKNDALSSLHEITIVVRDQLTTNAFIGEMSKHLDNFHSTATIKVNPGDSGATVGFKTVHSKRKKQNIKTISREDQGICAQFIKLYRGELLKQTADVYVNTAGESLNLRQGAVAASFLKAGGQDLQDECTDYVRKNGRVPCGDVVVTRPGAIHCTRIIHTVGPVYNGKASEKILHGLVQKCLETCDKLRASTIAFPALGAGNLNYPQSVVADIMVSTVTAYLKANRSTTCIKTVKLVIFMDNTYAEFDKLLSSKPNVAGSQKAPDDSEDLFSAETFSRAGVAKPFPRSSVTHSSAAEVFSAGTVKVEIRQGDITEDDSDAIVNTTNEKMQLVGSGVAAAILQKGGPEMQKHCDDVVSQGIQLQEGKVCDTPSAGNLKCFKVFHVVVPQNHKQMLGKTVVACLKRAEKLRLNSIAFPAIGTGILGYSLEEAAHEICSAIIVFGQKTNPVYVRRVRIIIFQKEMYRSFRDKFTEVTNKPGILKRMGAAVMSWFYSDDSSDAIEESRSSSDRFTEPVVVPHSPNSVSKITEKSVLLIQIYAEDKQKVDKTEARLLRIIDDQFTNEKVCDELISKLSLKQRDDLTRKAKLKHVEIIIETGADLNYIQLKGDCTDIADLKSDIQEILRQITSYESTKREAKLLQAKVKWQWLNDTNDYEDYDELPNYYIEAAYQRDKTKQFTYTTEDGTSEKFNFLKMEADDAQAIFKIKRVDIEDLLKEVESPGKWDTMPKGVACHIVDLDPKSTEYSEVKSKFVTSMGPLKILQNPPSSHGMVTKMSMAPYGQWSQIIKIERIQNPFLHAQYVAKKKTMDQHNPSNIVNERELFHGCPGDVVEKISHHGFNRSFAGKNATVYGKGVYFAHDASYSARDQYSPRDVNNSKHIFLAKVLTGEFTAGSSNSVTPPAKGGNSLTLYDSVVNDVSNPAIFVIFGDAQAYPDYLITFT